MKITDAGPIDRPDLQALSNYSILTGSPRRMLPSDRTMAAFADAGEGLSDHRNRGPVVRAAIVRRIPAS